MTITGQHFSDVITDNPVKIGYEYISGTDHYCYVLETSEYEIKCRTAEDWNRVTDTTNVIVFASTSEEAFCNEGGGCEYTYVDVSTLATLTTASASYDEDAETYSILVSGSGITDTDPSDFQIYIGGKEQLSVQATGTSVKAEIVDIDMGASPDTLQVYLKDGIVNGYSGLLGGIAFEPKLVEVLVHTGSMAGGVIRARVIGVGINDSITLVKEGTSNSICESSTVLEYGVLECVTKEEGVSAATRLGVRDTANNVSYDCGAKFDELDRCEYETWDDNNQPFVTIWELASPTTINARGDYFLPNDYSTCTLTFAGVTADTCTINSASSVSAVFDMGVPTIEELTYPVLTLLNDDGFTQAIALNSATVGISVPLVVSGETTITGCSFAGGCVHELTANGLAAKVKNGDGKIMVCQKECILREDLSSATKAACEVPQIQSTASN